MKQWLVKFKIHFVTSWKALHTASQYWELPSHKCTSVMYKRLKFRKQSKAWVKSLHTIRNTVRADFLSQDVCAEQVKTEMGWKGNHHSYEFFLKSVLGMDNWVISQAAYAFFSVDCSRDTQKLSPPWATGFDSILALKIKTFYKELFILWDHQVSLEHSSWGKYSSLLSVLFCFQTGKFILLIRDPPVQCL